MHICDLVGKPTLGLPHLPPCSDDAVAHTEEVRRAAYEAARRMAECGWRKGDPKWEHVGLQRDEGGQLRALFDEVRVWTAL
jgi:hypothetical protein